MFCCNNVSESASITPHSEVGELTVNQATVLSVIFSVSNWMYCISDPVPRESTMDSNHSIYFLSMLSGKLHFLLYYTATLYNICFFKNLFYIELQPLFWWLRLKTH